MDEQFERQPQRVPVRRASQKPTWERMLRKYFPTIRFFLICILLLLLICLAVKAVVVGIKLLFADKETAAVPYAYCQMLEEAPGEEPEYDFLYNV